MGLWVRRGRRRRDRLGAGQNKVLAQKEVKGNFKIGQVQRCAWPFPYLDTR